MSEIKCLENYKSLREMLQKGEKGDADYFASRLNISTRSFHRLLKYLKAVDGLDIRYNKTTSSYYINLE